MFTKDRSTEKKNQTTEAPAVAYGPETKKITAVCYNGPSLSTLFLKTLKCTAKVTGIVTSFVSVFPQNKANVTTHPTAGKNEEK